jgi:hypothetical protein
MEATELRPSGTMTAPPSAAGHAESGPGGIWAGYSDEPKPLPSYIGVMTVFGAAFGLALMTATRERNSRSRVGAGDIVLLGIATHKLSRLVSRDLVTSPIRAPFTQYVGEGDVPNEVSEKSRGKGAQKVVGELISCPFCLGTWLGSAMTFGLAFWPRATRLIASCLTVNTISDYLNTAYDKLYKK